LPPPPIFADEDVPGPLVARLRELGHDVLTTGDAGRAGQGLPDESVLKFATEAGRAVLTKNRVDFIHLHRRTPDHAGIIVFTEDPDYASLARRIDAATRGFADLDGVLIRITRPNPPANPRSS